MTWRKNNIVKHGVNANSVYQWMTVACLSGTLGTGCVAQQADLEKVQRDLVQQMTQIRAEKKSLTEEMGAARAAIADSQQLISAQKADMAKMRSDWAPLNQQIKLLREQDLTSLYGQNEMTEKKIADLRQDFTSQTEKMGKDLHLLQTTVQTQREQQQLAQTQSDALAQQIDKNNQTLTEKMTEFQTSFAQFKDILGNLGTNIAQTQASISSLETDTTSQGQILTTIQNQTNDHQQLITQVKGALEKSGAALGTQVTQQSAQLTQLEQQVNTLQNKLNTDTQALRNYLDQDVKTSINQMVADLDARQRPIIERLNALQSDVEALGIHIQADATQVQELSQSVVKLREAQDVMGSLLGKRGDEIIQQAGRLSERMSTVESHQTTLADQLQSNTKKTAAHLTEVNASLTSIAQNLDHATQSLTQRLTEQEKTLTTLNHAVQQFEPLKAETQSQIQQMQAARQLTEQLHQNIEQISRRLQDLEIHQSTLVGKLDSDGQTTTTHLKEVNQGIQSVAQALESVSAKLNTRISNQEQQLNQAMTTFQRVQESAKTSQTNAQHLNDLTDTMNQLREVITTIGTKLGERVDEHEDRLGQLAQRVNQLQGTKPKK